MSAPNAKRRFIMISESDGKFARAVNAAIADGYVVFASGRTWEYAAEGDCGETNWAHMLLAECPVCGGTGAQPDDGGDIPFNSKCGRCGGDGRWVDTVSGGVK